MVPWALSPGNFVHVYWLNWRLRTMETQGVVREIRGDVVLITQSKSTSLDKATEIHVERVKHVDVITEGEEAKDARRKAWELVRQAAGCINLRSEWDSDGFFKAMEQLAIIFPQIKQTSEE